MTSMSFGLKRISTASCMIKMLKPSVKEGPDTSPPIALIAPGTKKTNTGRLAKDPRSACEMS